MNSDEKLQALLRLKRREQPPEGYFEDFLKDFHTRQRRDLMQQSLFSQISERLRDFCAVLTRPRVLIPAGACYLGIMLLLLTWPHAPKAPGNTVVVLTTTPAGNVGQQPQLQPVPSQNGNTHFTSLPPAPMPNNGLLQVDTTAPQNSPKRPRVNTPENLKKLIGEPIPAENPTPEPPPPANGKLREF